MHIRTPHSAYEPDDGERNRWSGLFIIAASFAAWAFIVLGVRWAWPDLVRLARWAWEVLL